VPADLSHLHLIFLQHVLSSCAPPPLSHLFIVQRPIGQLNPSSAQSLESRDCRESRPERSQSSLSLCSISINQLIENLPCSWFTPTKIEWPSWLTCCFLECFIFGRWRVKCSINLYISSCVNYSDIFTCITTNGMINDYQNDEDEVELSVDATFSMTNFPKGF
jgi:hypothetical protein